MQRALILGGGFIGDQLAQRLSAGGYRVRSVDLREPRHSLSHTREFLVGDLRDAAFCTLALGDGFDEVYQLATACGPTRTDTVRDSLRIDLNILGACTRVRVGRLLRAVPPDEWSQPLVEQLYRLHANELGLTTRIARLPTVFGPGGWDPAVTPLCRDIATADSRLELSADNRVPLALLPLDECLDDLLRVMHTANTDPVSLRSYSLTVRQLAIILADLAGKTLSIHGLACTEGRGAADRGSSRLGWNTRLREGLASTYRWVTEQLEREAPPVPERARSRSISDHCLLDRVREAVRGREVIDWPDTDFRSLADDLDASFLRPGIDDESLAGLKDGSIYVSGLGDMIRKHAHRPTTHVLLARLDENWGAFSHYVPDRTWSDERVIAKGCTPEQLQRYLDDPSAKAVVTTQHTALSHPAILSIPIGIHSAGLLTEHLAQGDGERSRELLISNSGWAFRTEINERVSGNFGGHLRNEYGLPLSDFYRAVLRSKFVLCPPGWGWDSHRLWETLILGAIPVLEHSEGWHKVLDDLPALWVKRFDEVTPALLAKAWRDIHARCNRFDFSKLTKQWWTQRIKGRLRALRSGKT